MSDEESWAQASKAILNSQTVAVCCHIAPDGDALGAMLGLGHFLERQGKHVWMSWGSPEIKVPYQYSFLPGADRLRKAEDLPERIETFIAIDCADVKRLDLLQDRFRRAATSINIDHHVSNLLYGDVNLVDPSRASSCELGYELVKRLGGRVDPAEATCFYTGIVTDTGRFQYSNAAPATLRVAAELLEAGADHLLIAERVYQSASFGQLKLLGTVLSRAKLDDGLVYSWLTVDDLGEVGIEETEDFIDVLRSIRDIRVALLAKQQPSGGWKGSLRSRGGVDVSEVAKSFGGRGHAA
ncbi:MAG: bifunctional oligoribonuclease/PAP phosphatase NrnA, partial [Actinomycetota bacterium]|nr:bifunctional oligoribonuclease/PAP phosphatase NrnA [Actinomycetota bacterium]